MILKYLSVPPLCDFLLDLTFSSSSSSTVKQTCRSTETDISVKFLPGCVLTFHKKVHVGSLACLRRVPMPFSSTCSPNLSASRLGSTEVFWFCPRLRLIKFPFSHITLNFIQPNRLHWSRRAVLVSSIGGCCVIRLACCMMRNSAAVASAESVHSCNLLTGETKEC